jgi:hypothetical protein
VKNGPKGLCSFKMTYKSIAPLPPAPPSMSRRAMSPTVLSHQKDFPVLSHYHWHHCPQRNSVSTCACSRSCEDSCAGGIRIASPTKPESLPIPWSCRRDHVPPATHDAHSKCDERLPMCSKTVVGATFAHGTNSDNHLNDGGSDYVHAV